MFHKQLRQARKRSGLTQQQLADRVGDALEGVLLSQQAISEWERNESRPGDRNTVLALCQALYRHGAFRSLAEIESLLRPLGQGRLYGDEIQQWLPELLIEDIPADSQPTPPGMSAAQSSEERISQLSQQFIAWLGRGIETPAQPARREEALWRHDDVDALARTEAEASSADAQHRQTLIASLPAATYQRLVGCDHYLQAITETLDAQGNRRQPIFLTGLGGIGKTSVAREALAGWLSQEKGMVQDVAWAMLAQSPLSLTPRIQKPLQRYALDQILAELGQQLQVAANALPNNERRLQALRHRLVDAPAVVVIDNVETPDEVQLALTIVQHLTAVAQILVTSRYRIDYPTGLSLVLRELSQADAMTLLHMEARRLDIQKADAATLQRICATVGGNPHALKLILAQLRYLPVERMLGAFSGHFTAQALFAHIYETAWSLLSAEAQQVLLGLWLLPPAGATWEGLRAAVEASGRPCDDDALGQIVHELSLLNLLQASAPPKPVYTLHRLTYHFLESKMDSLLEQNV